ncbi:MAG: GNAT family N-acetyltransferase [Chlamydiae bacterium]|nr:GNAT family N-acetyltransferase [Chlamydiota bacterium]
MSMQQVLPQVNFQQAPDRSLHVDIETARLHLESCRSKHIPDYQSLFSSSIAMEKYADGKPKDASWVEDRVKNLWERRWKEGDPFSAFAVYQKEGGFLGHVVIGHGFRPGQAELAFVFHPHCWKQGIATEAVEAVLKNYLSKVPEELRLLKGRNVEVVEASARHDHTAALRVLEKVGMQMIRQQKEFGQMRHRYSFSVGLSN